MAQIHIMTNPKARAVSIHIISNDHPTTQPDGTHYNIPAMYNQGQLVENIGTVGRRRVGLVDDYGRLGVWGWRYRIHSTEKSYGEWYDESALLMLAPAEINHEQLHFLRTHTAFIFEFNESTKHDRE